MKPESMEKIKKRLLEIHNSFRDTKTIEKYKLLKEHSEQILEENLSGILDIIRKNLGERKKIARRSEKAPRKDKPPTIEHVLKIAGEDIPIELSILEMGETPGKTPKEGFGEFLARFGEELGAIPSVGVKLDVKKYKDFPEHDHYLSISLGEEEPKVVIPREIPEEALSDLAESFLEKKPKKQPSLDKMLEQVEEAFKRVQKGFPVNEQKLLKGLSPDPAERIIIDALATTEILDKKGNLNIKEMKKVEEALSHLFNKEFSGELKRLGLSGSKTNKKGLFGLYIKGEEWKDKLEEIAEEKEAQKAKAEAENKRKETFLGSVSARLEAVNRDMGIDLTEQAKTLSDALYGREGGDELARLENAINDTVDDIRREVAKHFEKDEKNINSIQALHFWSGSGEISGLIDKMTKDGKTKLGRIMLELAREGDRELPLNTLVSRLKERSLRDLELRLEPLKKVKQVTVSQHGIQLTEPGKKVAHEAILIGQPKTSFKATKEFTKRLKERLRA